MIKIFYFSVCCITLLFFCSCEQGIIKSDKPLSLWKAEEGFSDPKVVELCHAIEQKDVVKMEKLIAGGADVNAVGKDNIPLLLWSCPFGEEAFIMFITTWCKS